MHGLDDSASTNGNATNWNRIQPKITLRRGREGKTSHPVFLPDKKNVPKHKR